MTPGQRAKRNQQAKIWRDNNKESVRLTNRKQQAKNREKYTADRSRRLLEQLDRMTQEERDAYRKRRNKQNRERLSADPLKQQRHREAVRKWREANKEKRRAYVKEYRSRPETIELERRYADTHKKQTRERGERWRKQNIQRHRLNLRAQQHRRRIRREASAGCYTKEQALARCEFFGWLCRYCAVKLHRKRFTLDHQIPLSLGGTNWPSNLVPSCLSCNSKKQRRKPIEAFGGEALKYVWKRMFGEVNEPLRPKSLRKPRKKNLQKKRGQLKLNLHRPGYAAGNIFNERRESSHPVNAAAIEPASI